MEMPLLTALGNQTGQEVVEGALNLAKSVQQAFGTILFFLEIDAAGHLAVDVLQRELPQQARKLVWNRLVAGYHCLDVGAQSRGRLFIDCLKYRLLATEMT